MLHKKTPYAVLDRLVILALMSDNAKKLNELLGAAMRSMLNTGADDAALGQFAAEFRERAVQILGPGDTSSLTDPFHAGSDGSLTADLTQFIRATTREAVNHTLEQINLAPSSGRRRPGRPMSVERAVRVNFTLRGKRSALSIEPSSFNALVRLHKGSKPAARQMVRDVASRIPESITNKSTWVQERIVAILAAQSQPKPDSQHQH
jgi:hypothetical protein